MRLSVEDRLAVQDVVILYGHFHDSRQSHRIADEIFCADATIDFGTGLVSGREAIRAFFAGFKGILGTSHNISNLIVDGEGNRGPLPEPLSRLALARTARRCRWQALASCRRHAGRRGLSG